MGVKMELGGTPSACSRNLRHSSTMLQAVDDEASMELPTCHAFPNSAKIDSILVYRNNATDCRQ